MAGRGTSVSPAHSVRPALPAAAAQIYTAGQSVTRKDFPMSHFRPVALEHASRLLNHGPTVLITSRSRDGAKRNVMAAAWSMPVEFSPPRIAIVVDKGAHSRQMIEESGAFGICVPAAMFIDATYAVGSVSGLDEDKFARFHIAAAPSATLQVPLIEQGCVAWLECRLLPESGAQEKYDTCFGEVLSAAADERVFQQGRWNFTAANADLHTIHHLGAGNFVRSGETLRAKPL
ncbi:putative flavin reductase [Serratia marcescens subsp. marcescens Db11]|uniref:Flavin reductase n=2 Tax=Serratia TaxID=613 RepID=A0ABC9IDV4_SERMA|nr:putative flavin reductase [Serratia marcescens subsp. marcescens Db11]